MIEKTLRPVCLNCQWSFIEIEGKYLCLLDGADIDISKGCCEVHQYQHDFITDFKAGHSEKADGVEFG